MEIVFVRHGESIANVANGKAYDPYNVCLTEHGVKQAEKTGHFLQVFGKFDVVIMSPMLRVAETTEQIVNTLGYSGNVVIDDRLIERGNNYDTLDGLSREQRAKIVPKELYGLEQALVNEPNPFVRKKLSKKFRLTREKLLPLEPSMMEANDNYIDFLNWLGKQKYNRVLIISHSYTMNCIMKIICGINEYNSWIQIGSQSQKRWLENCSIMCVYYHKNTDVYELISGPEDRHLQNI